MKKYVVILLLLTGSGGLFAQMPDSVKRYLDSALYFMQTKSLFANSVNWQATRDSVFMLAKEARSYQDAFPALVYAFKQLKDYHGMAANADTFYRYPPPVDFDAVLSDGIKAAFRKGNRIVTHYYDSLQLAYLRVPGMQAFSQEDIDAHANALRDSLCALLARHPRGIIVDLRMNAGGNAVPMISGIGPLFRDTILGYGVDRDGRYLPATKIRDAVLLDEAGNPLTAVHNHCKAAPGLKMAVLIGPSTVSSGEILAVFLKQQANTRTFGEPSGRFCNATEGFLFMNNQGYLLLSVNKIADAHKNIYEELMVRPDETISSKQDNFDQVWEDPAFIAASRWLQGL